MKIAMIGATGMLGRPVVNELIAAGNELSILVRNRAKAENMFGQNVRYIAGDLREIDSVKKLLAGQDGLYLNLSVLPSQIMTDFLTEREGIDNILGVAKDCGIKRIGFMSSLAHFYQGQNGFDWWVFDIKAKAVEKIKACGIPYTIFYPSTFMESFSAGGYRRGNIIALAGTSRQKMYLISGSDYGKQVARAFQMNQGNHEYTVQGAEGFTADEAAAIFAKNYKKTKIIILKAPLGLLKILGSFARTPAYGSKILDALNNYPEVFDSDQTWDELGKPTTSYLQFIESL